MANVIIEEVSVNGCVECREFEEFWKSIQGQFPNVEMKHIDATTPEGLELVQKHFIMSAPGIIVNSELFSSGGFDRKKLLEKLTELSK